MKKVFSVLILIPLLLGCPPKRREPMPMMFIVGFSMETGAEPSFLITEDFNQDGNLDLVVTNSGDNTFSYFKGVGDGTFENQLVFKTGQDPICIVAGYFNGDGYLDLAVLNYADQTINVYLNSQGGSFKHTGEFIKPGKIPINFAAGDFNGDGLSDLAVTLRYHKVVVLIGKGNGNFREPVSYPVKGQPTGIVAGDYNNDKKKDLAVALAGSGNTGVELLWGKGDGTFEPSQRFKGGGQPLTILNVDLNGDGYTDMVTSSNVLHALTALINNRDGTFNTLKDFASGNFPKFAAAADFSGDGIPDLAVSNSTDDLISISLGNGDGTFTYPPVYHPADEYPQGLAVGDFNKDGLIDLATSCRDKGMIDILLKKNMVNPKPDSALRGKTAKN